MLIKLIKYKKLLIIIVFLFIIAFLIYRNYASGLMSKKIDTTRVKLGNLEEKMTISGEISADEHTTLRFQSSGRLMWVGVKEGDYVKKYQTIASLDKREVKKNLEKKLYDYQKTRLDFDQGIKDTYKDQIITNTIKRILDKNQYDLNKSVLDVELQNLSIEYANLWTPIEGILTRVSIPYTGVNITPSQAEFEIVNPNTVFFSATADQSEVVKLKEGLSGELTLDSYPQATLSGKIRNISFVPKTGETNTVYEIKFDFSANNVGYKYRLGMTGDLFFVTKRKENVMYVPSKFIKNINGKKYLHVKRNGNDEKVEVTTDMETDTYTEITSGISNNEIVYE